MLHIKVREDEDTVVVKSDEKVEIQILQVG